MSANVELIVADTEIFISSSSRHGALAVILFFHALSCILLWTQVSPLPSVLSK